ncbi:MAG: signal recognition particle-docking protein FtsY, partial [Bacteroidales bacterium]|nr:signal recognition particle-docking protein FtsY [Bacteroidales bacterium]
MGIFDKGIKKTNRGFFDRISHAIIGKAKVDEDLLDAMEEALIATDMGVDTTMKIIENLEERVSRDKYVSIQELAQMLREEIAALLDADSESEGSAQDASLPFDFSKKPYVVMVVGVNGVGKTTTIGKLASRLKSMGKKVVLGAADTFRAAAVDQLTIWAERAGVDIVKQEMGSDPASVAYDTLKSAVAKNADVVLIDTAGRLHNRIDLMNELTKIRNVMRKVVPDAPHEVLLVLDASTGQNAFQQAKEFSRATDITSLA